MTMLDRMRRHLGWLKWSLALVVLTFVLFYVPDFVSSTGSGATGEAVATVQDRRITANEFTRAYNAQMTQFRGAYGSGMNDAMIRQLGLDRQVLQQMVDQQAVLAEADRLGLSATDAEVRARIVSIPAFQENGQFIGEQRYRQLLRLQRPPLSPSDFEEEVRSSVVLDKMRATLTEWITVTDAEADAESRRRTEKVTLDVVPFPAVEFAAAVQPTDPELTTFFDQQKETYRIGERRKVRYLLVDVQAIRGNIAVPEQDIQRAYKLSLDQYSQPEQVRASHILLNTEGKDEAAVRARADALLSQIKGGAEFATLAKANSQDTVSATRGGDLDFFARGRMVPEFDAVAFALPVGQVSDLVKTQYGFHIIKVTDKKAAEVQPLDAVRPQITEQLRFERAQTRAQDLATAIAAEVKGPADLDKAAASRGLKVQESPLFTRDEPIPGLGAAADVSAQAFSLAPGSVSGPVRTGTGIAFLTVTGTEAPRLPTLADVKDRVRADLVKRKTQDLARTRATAVAATLKGAADFAAAAKTAGRTVRTSDAIARGAAIPEVGPSPAVDQVAFTLPVGAVSDPIPTANGAVIVRVVNRTSVPAADLASQRDATRRELASQRRAQFFASYMNKAKEAMDIRIDQSVLQRLTT
ncbi:MAG: peptidyl-prolyl cis-trans isomerase [Luteitalea sp.]|nr:peptidyl-prolyl cis-trans isomerase [Acidobacteriota bacterium]